MIYLRSALFFIGKSLSTIPFLFISLVAFFFPPTTRSKIISGWAYFVTWWLKVCCGLKHQVSGLENIPEQPAVFACNHSSTWESIATQTFLPPMAWVLKKELLKIPVFGWGLWATQPIAIDRRDRKNALDQVVEQGKSKLAEGRHVLIFPEGTRTPYGQVGNYKKGAAKLALAADVPIIPIAHNAGKFWPKSCWLVPTGIIECRIGPPISVSGKDDKQISEEIKSWILAQQL